MAGPNPEQRRAVFDAFYALPARRVMDPDVDAFAFVPPHLPVEDALDVLAGTDHAWVVDDPGRSQEVRSILLRRDLIRAIQPAGESYSRASRARHRSLAHGSADCTCCFTRDRVLHSVTPATPCQEVLRVIEAKGALVVPVVDDGRLVGEIGPAQLLEALRRLLLVKEEPA